MSRFIPFAVLFALIVTASFTPTSFAADTTQWKLVWADEFDQTGTDGKAVLPDASKWTYEEGFIRNHEAQYYTRGRLENARVENGTLIIEARKEPYGSKDGKQAEITSASVTTNGLHSWTDGRIEVSAKLPEGRGVWPAIWMLGDAKRKVGWPDCGEIDILEFVGYMPEVVHANVHMKKYNHKLGTGKGAKTKSDSLHDKFHIYAIEWDQKKIDFFFDDEKYFTFENEGTGSDVWPFDKPHYLILNLAIGGSWGGSKGIDDSIFPQRMTVDYVRVYENQ